MNMRKLLRVAAAVAAFCVSSGGGPAGSRSVEAHGAAGAIGPRTSAERPVQIAPPIAFTAAYVPAIEPFGDSITHGTGSTQWAGWRELVYGAARTDGHPFVFVGTETYAGANSTFTIDPWNDGVPGIAASDLNANIIVRMLVHNPDVVIYAAGTNDIAINGASASTVANTISAGLDAIWAMRTNAHFQIVLCTILKRLDAFDSVVQATDALLPGVVAGKSYASHISLVDVYGAIKVPVVDGTNYWDQVHPADVGYQDITTVLAPAVEAAVIKARGRRDHARQRRPALAPRIRRGLHGDARAAA